MSDEKEEVLSHLDIVLKGLKQFLKDVDKWDTDEFSQLSMCEELEYYKDLLKSVRKNVKEMN